MPEQPETGPEGLAAHRHFVDRLAATWPLFRSTRAQRLAGANRFGVAVEKVAENVIEDLFTGALDWARGDLNHQVDRADIVLSHNYVKYLLIEAKRPGSLAWSRSAVEHALDQARGYADEQHVNCIGVSDGRMLYVADVVAGGLRDRVFVDLASEAPPPDLWWVSLHGIYRQRPAAQIGEHLLPTAAPVEASGASSALDGLVHPKYRLPSHCFAYVGHAADPSTWRLPYRLQDGSVDVRRLPKAIQAVLTNYRGAKVGGIPDDAIPAVLQRLAEAAASVGRMPEQQSTTAPAYQQLAAALAQMAPSGTGRQG